MDPRGFPTTLPEFQRVFPDDRACATYLERLRWADGFACPKCGVIGEPYRFAARPEPATPRHALDTATATAHLGELRSASHPDENAIVAASVAGAANIGGLALGFQVLEFRDRDLLQDLDGPDDLKLALEFTAQFECESLAHSSLSFLDKFRRRPAVRPHLAGCAVQ